MPRARALAKLTAPKLGRVLARTRLLKQLDRLAHHKLIWIAAPAGSGKTTLAADWLRSRKRAHLWYQVDAGDRDIAAFFNYLAMAAERESRLKNKLTRFTPEYQLGLPAFSRNYFRKLFAHINPPACIVLDNYQDVGEATVLDTVLAHALDELPAGITLIALSRGALPAALARHEANGVVEQISAPELELTAEEEAAVVKLTLGERRLKPDELARLHQATRGWVAGLLLALREIKANVVGEETSVIEAIAHAPAQDPARIFDYFAAEIMARIDLETREFLYAVALLPTMTATLCEALTHNHDAKTILQRLVHEHFFTTRRGVLSASYEFHPLFRQFLRAQGEIHIGRQRLHALKRRAGRLLAEVGENESAVALLTAVQDWPTLAELIRSLGPKLEKQGRHQTLQHWLAALPEAERESDAWLLYWNGTAQLPTDPFAAYELYGHAYRRFLVDDDVQGLYLSWIGIATSLFFRHDDMHPAREWVEELERLRERHSKWPSLEVRGRVTTAALSILMVGYPEHPTLPAWLARTERIYRLIPIGAVRCFIGSQLGLYYSFFGEIGKLSALAEQLRPLVSSPKIPDIARIMANSVLVFAGWQAGNMRAADEAIAQGLKLLDDSGAYVTAQWFFGSAGIIKLSRFEVDEAERFIEMFRNNASPLRRAEGAYLELMSGWRELILGHFETARAQFESAYAVSELTHAMHFPLKALGGLVQTLTELGEFSRARTHLDTLRRLSADTGYSMFSEFFCHLLEAYLLDKSGGARAEVLEALKRGFASGAKHQWIVMLCWERNLITRLCVLALQHDIEPDYAKHLIRIYHLTPPVPGAPIERWPYPLKLYALGSFEVTKDDQPLPTSTKGQRKPLDLLMALIALGGQNVSLGAISQALWPDAEGDAAKGTFDTTLHRLRKLLGADEAILAADGRLSLNPRYCWCDARALEQNIERLEQSLAGNKIEELDALGNSLLVLYRGPFLAGIDEAWALPRRERLRSRFLRALTMLGVSREDTGDWDKAIECYARGLEVDPLAEELHRRLMIAYRESGRLTEALAAYERCRQLFHKVLGVLPSPATEDVQRSLRVAARNSVP